MVTILTMSMRFSVSRVNAYGEKMSVDGAMSFDEAFNHLERGVREREAVLKEQGAVKNGDLRFETAGAIPPPENTTAAPTPEEAQQKTQTAWSPFRPKP